MIVILKSDRFIVRKFEDKDKEDFRKLEMSRSWAGAMMEQHERIAQITGNRIDYFDYLWNIYSRSGYFWVIEGNVGNFCGVIHLDIKREDLAQFIIHLKNGVDITGFGQELFDKMIHYLADITSIKVFYMELWEDGDRSRQIYEEAGYDTSSGFIDIKL